MTQAPDQNRSLSKDASFQSDQYTPIQEPMYSLYRMIIETTVSRDLKNDLPRYRNDYALEERTVREMVHIRTPLEFKIFEAHEKVSAVNIRLHDEIFLVRSNRNEYQPQFEMNHEYADGYDSDRTHDPSVGSSKMTQTLINMRSRRGGEQRKMDGVTNYDEHDYSINRCFGKKVGRTIQKKQGIYGGWKNGFSEAEVSWLLDCVHKCLPMGSFEWEEVYVLQSKKFSGTNLTIVSLNRKFVSLWKKTAPTGDDSIPRKVLRAKKINEELVRK